MLTALYSLHAQISVSGLPNRGHGDPAKTAIGVTLNIVFAITASVALLMIVIAGLRYIVARGNPDSTAKARESIIYAVAGLAVTLAAYGIVTFVLKGLS